MSGLTSSDLCENGGVEGLLGRQVGNDIVFCLVESSFLWGKQMKRFVMFCVKDKAKSTALNVESQGFQGQRSLMGCSPWVHKELDMTEQLSTEDSYPPRRVAVPKAGTPRAPGLLLWGIWTLSALNTQIRSFSQTCGPN